MDLKTWIILSVYFLLTVGIYYYRFRLRQGARLFSKNKSTNHAVFSHLWEKFPEKIQLEYPSLNKTLFDIKTDVYIFLRYLQASHFPKNFVLDMVAYINEGRIDVLVDMLEGVKGEGVSSTDLTQFLIARAWLILSDRNKAISILKELADNAPHLPENYLFFRDLGLTLIDILSYKEAESYLYIALSIQKDRSKIDEQELLEAYSNCCFLLSKRETIESFEAMRVLLEEWEIFQKSSGMKFMSCKWYKYKGDIESNEGNYTAATGFYDRALDIATMVYGDGDTNVRWVCRAIADLNEKKGYYKVCISYHERWLALVNRSEEWNDYASLFQVYESLGRVYFRMNYCVDAINAYEQSLLYQGKLDVSPSFFSGVYQALGHAYIAIGLWNYADSCFMELLRIHRGKDVPGVSLVDIYVTLGFIAYQLYQCDEALNFFDEAAKKIQYLYSDSGGIKQTEYFDKIFEYRQLCFIRKGYFYDVKNRLTQIELKGFDTMFQGALISTYLGRLHYDRAEWDYSRLYYTQVLDYYVHEEGGFKAKLGGVSDVYLSYAHQGLALICFSGGIVDEAMRYLDMAIDMELSQERLRWYRLTELYRYYADMYVYQGKILSAVSFVEKKVIFFKDRVGENSYYLGCLYQKLGELFSLKRNYSSANNAIQESLRISKLVFHLNDVLNMELYLMLAEIDTTPFDKDAKKKFSLKQVMDLLDDQKVMFDPLRVCDIRLKLGELFYKDQNYDYAIVQFKKAMKVIFELLGEGHCSPRLARCYAGIGECFRLLKLYQKSDLFLKKSYQIYTKLYGKSHVFMWRIYHYLGCLYYDLEQYEDAIREFRYAINLKKDYVCDSDLEMGLTAYFLGKTFYKSETYDFALNHYLVARTIYQEILGDIHPDTLSLSFDIASVYEHQHHYDAALTLYSDIKERYQGSDKDSIQVFLNEKITTLVKKCTA